MVLPFDDHMVHRGHGVFDTAAIVDGKVYNLEAHLDRFVRSAGPGSFGLPPAASAEPGFFDRRSSGLVACWPGRDPASACPGPSKPIGENWTLRGGGASCTRTHPGET